MSQSYLVEFFVPGSPMPEPRPRAAVVRGRPRVYKPASARDWKALVRMVAAQKMDREPSRGALRVRMVFALSRPSSHFGRGRNQGKLRGRAPAFPMHQRSDVDNLAKGILDAMSGLVFEDDRQVCTLEVEKRYLATGEVPGTSVAVFELNGEDGR